MCSLVLVTQQTESSSEEREGFRCTLGSALLLPWLLSGCFSRLLERGKQRMRREPWP